jgi:hypothetical protein
MRSYLMQQYFTTKNAKSTKRQDMAAKDAEDANRRGTACRALQKTFVSFACFVVKKQFRGNGNKNFAQRRQESRIVV